MNSAFQPAGAFPSPEVVRIPARFFRSKKTKKSRSALKIQKLFRGFLVRKNVKKIAAIEKEVEETEGSLSKDETLDLIRRESKERLRINEALMRLLFKLDSIRGGDYGVRVLRKAVIKKAIVLQEKLDSVCAIESSMDCGDCSNQHEPIEIDDSSTADSGPFGPGHSGVMKGMFGTENNRNEQILENMVEDNKKMMSLMTQLFERVEIQNQMLGSLMQRVEQLEKRGSTSGGEGP